MPRNDRGITKLLDRGQDADDYQRQFKLLIAQIVEEKVQEALTHEQDSIFQPFFQSKEISREIKRRQTVSEQQKWAHYFEEWGCLACGTKEKAHGSLGMCLDCHGRISRRLSAIVRAHTPRPEAQPTFMDTVRLAREALAPSIEVLQEETAIARRKR